MLLRAIQRPRRSLLRSRDALLLLVTIATLWVFILSFYRDVDYSRSSTSFFRRDIYNPVTPTIPDGVKVIALVFYGRKEFVQILDCYLKVG
jgi:hypothetical protein